MKKKYLQACELGGSIYGKKRTTMKKSPGKKSGNSDGMVTAYNDFYKSQVDALYKAFKRG